MLRGPGYRDSLALRIRRLLCCDSQHTIVVICTDSIDIHILREIDSALKGTEAPLCSIKRLSFFPFLLALLPLNSQNIPGH